MSWINSDKTSFRFDFRDISIHLVFGVLAFMAYCMYAERMFADASYYLLHLINKESFHVEHQRLVLAISQILPWIGVKLGFSMKAILVLFSVGHVVFFYLIFLISRYWYQDTGAGLLLLLLQTLGLEMGYFTPMFELYYGAGLLVLFASILWAQRLGKADILLLAILTLGILTSHPVAILLWAFVLVLHALDFKRLYLQWYVIFTLGLVLYLVYKFIGSSAYEETKTLAFLDTLRVMSYGKNYIFELCGFMLKYYIELLLLFTLWSVWMIAGRKYVKLTVVALSFVMMLIVINGAHYGFQHSRYQEQVYFPLSWIVAFPFVLSLKEVGQKFWQRFLWIVAMILIGVKIIAILEESRHFTQRISRMERLINWTRQVHVSKAVVGERNVTHGTSAGPNWSYGIETLLLSARNGRDSTVTICLDTDIAFERNRDSLTSDQFLMRKWDIYPSALLNQEYFNLKDGLYIPLSSGSPVSNPVDTFKSAIHLVIPVKDIHMPRGHLRPVDVLIQNRSRIPIPSDSTNAVFLSYHWTLDSEMITWDGQRTPLEVDIISTYNQTIDVMSPDNPGHYTLIIDLVAEGRGWFGIETKNQVWVY